jgi:hypothetical protein
LGRCPASQIERAVLAKKSWSISLIAVGLMDQKTERDADNWKPDRGSEV